jgi:hypothetical protein
MQIRLSAEVLEYLKEGIENATGCEDSDVDHDFANELERLMTGPLYTAPMANYPQVEWGPMVVAPVAGEALTRFCPECGRVGDVGAGYRDCCPDGGSARMIPKSMAEKCRANFLLAIKQDAAPQASEAVRIPTVIDLLIRAQAWMATTRGSNRPTNLIRLIDAALAAQPGAQKGNSDEA